MKKKIKSLFLVLLVLSLAFSLASCGKKKDLLETIKERGYIIIATEGVWSPWTYHDDSGKLTGFDVEMARLIAEKLGVEARFEETAWEAILAGVDSGRFDIACNGVGFTEERAKSYMFSEPYLYTSAVLLVQNENTDITCFEDLNGKKTANSVGSTYAALAESYGATVQNVDTLEETITLLVQGRIDATINARVSYQDYMNEHPDTAIKVVDEADTDMTAIPVKMSDDSKALVEAINKALQELKADGSLGRLSEQFFGLDLTKPSN
ncbi:MAG: transporter substrate-binding domain-containing protein [Oscillospiraceae bacterium]|jgi:cystine transport system substrate-binding protein|nr:transporter substrate-binding domain-containing protein [Oscillospiraceae bacterium]MBQ5412118.1 transporter substrate-binding domain-containing protein [Oscillospiraceae bacterium]